MVGVATHHLHFNNTILIYFIMITRLQALHLLQNQIGGDVKVFENINKFIESGITGIRIDMPENIVKNLSANTDKFLIALYVAPKGQISAVRSNADATEDLQSFADFALVKESLSFGCTIIDGVKSFISPMLDPPPPLEEEEGGPGKPKKLEVAMDEIPKEYHKNLLKNELIVKMLTESGNQIQSFDAADIKKLLAMPLDELQTFYVNLRRREEPLFNKLETMLSPEDFKKLGVDLDGTNPE